MFSMPPARTTSASPKAISCAAETMAWSPEPHILFNVMPGTSTGRPLFMPTWRPGFMPWPAERMLPTITWSTCSPSIPALERTSLPTVAPRSVAGVSLSEPPKVPIPVLRGVEMTISPLPLPKLTFSPSVYSWLEDTSKDKAQAIRPGPLYTLQRLTLRLLVGPALHLVQVAFVVGEHGVQEVHVSVDRLLGQCLGGLPLLALLLDQVLREGPVALGLGPQVVDNAVEEVLRQLGVELLGRDGAVCDGLVGFFQRISKLLRRFVDLLLLLLVHDLTSSFFSLHTYSLLPDMRAAKHQRRAKVRSGPESPPQKVDPDSYALPGGLPRGLQ